ncbi:MAG: hypothetical protein AAGA58_05295 [Verrucomicrobiota bacterium]
MSPASQNQIPIFAGTESRALDDNHRVTVPSRWRHESLRELYAVPDPRQPLLMLMTAGEMDLIREKLENDPQIDAGDRRTFMRQFFSQASPCSMDKQGRLVLPAEQCERYGLSGEVVLVGGGARIEVWSRSEWDSVCSREKDVFASVASRIGL